MRGRAFGPVNEISYRRHIARDTLLNKFGIVKMLIHNKVESLHSIGCTQRRDLRLFRCV